VPPERAGRGGPGLKGDGRRTVETITGQTVCLEGAPRFRDLGGIAAADDQTIRWGILYRSEALWRLTETDLDVLRALRLRTVCDLRGEPERLRSPHRWPDGLAVDFLNLDPAWVDEPHDERFLRMVRADFSETGAKAALEDYYRRLPAGYAANLPRLFSRLSDPRGIPAVILCQHGKDRTGFVVALVLSALGVSPEAIRDDYAITGPVRHAEDAGRATQFFTAVLGRKPDPAAIAAVLASHLDCLNAAFDTITRDFGSAENYLASAGGLDADRLSRLRALLLE
jgi:protein-tyrosine phosphatase